MSIMKTPTAPRPTRSRLQRGAVAIMLGLSIFVLFGFMALAIDLGRTYVVRTELQNAADAAALAGAKQLNQTAAGVCCGSDSAVAYAVAMAAQNNFKFSSAVTITIANMSVGSCPDDGCMVPASSVTTNALAAGKTFLKVDIPSGGLATFFARVPTTAAGTGIPSTSTYGRAVAGLFLREITPIGICAIDLIKGGTRDLTPPTAVKELTEFGFRRGVPYNIMELGPLAGSGQPYLLNPVDTWPGPPCDPGHSSAPYTAAFVCAGTSAAIATVPGNVFGNTGISGGPMQVALNSRFNVNSCAPQDTNVKTYDFGSAGAGDPKNWMEPGASTQPSRQAITIDPATQKPVAAPTFADYGVLWSYSRAVQAVGTSPNATAGDPFTLADWPSLYNGGAADIANYPPAPPTPPFPSGTQAAPYNTQSGSDYFLAPPIAPGSRNRRVLNIAIVNCPAATGVGCNSTIPVVGIGRFFMQVEANFNGSPKKIEAEFAGLVDPLPPPTEIRLYK
jgi:Flp pilus assembly protein TadG